MTVAQPTVLAVLNDASGSTIANDGTSGDWTIQQGVEDTDYSWNSGGGSYDGQFTSLTYTGTSHPYATSADTLGTTPVNQSFACRISVSAFDGTVGYLLAATHTATDTPVSIVLLAPTSTGAFNLRLRFGTTASYVQVLYEDLAFDTSYALAASLNTDTISAVELRAKLDSGTVQSSGTSNWTAGSIYDEWPSFLTGGGYTNIRGIAGVFDYLVYDVDGTAWSDTDLADINSDPAGTITGWPSAGGGTLLINKGFSGGMSVLDGGLRG